MKEGQDCVKDTRVSLRDVPSKGTSPHSLVGHLLQAGFHLCILKECDLISSILGSERVDTLSLFVYQHCGLFG